MNYIIAQSWKELSDEQTERLSELIFTENYPEKAIEMLKVLFIKENTFWQRLKFQWLLLQVPFSELVQYLNFLKKEPQVFEFPVIHTLQAPNRMLGNISIEQFSVADKIFYDWRKTGDFIYLRQLCAALYTKGEFSKEKLPEIAEITDTIRDRRKYHIVLAYMSCRQKIVEQFPVVFPKKAEDKEIEIPQFSSADKKYVSFNEVIISMAFDENQPIGNYHIAKHTKIFDFLHIFTRTLERQEQMRREIEKSKR